MPKIEYGIKNVYFAIRKRSEEGTISYDTPFAVPNARSTDMAPQGETTPIYADNVIVYTSNSNQGYSGSLAFTTIPDEVLEKLLGYIKDSKGNLLEDANAESVPFAMMFQFETDEKAVRHIFYNCTLARPNVASQTKEASVTVSDKTLTITAAPDSEILPGYTIVKGKSTKDTDATAYNSWFTSVQIPTLPAEEETDVQS